MTSLSHSAPPWKIHRHVQYKYRKVGRDLTCKAGKEEAEDERKEPVEMSLTEDPGEANTQDDVEVFPASIDN